MYQAPVKAFLAGTGCLCAHEAENAESGKVGKVGKVATVATVACLCPLISNLKKLALHQHR